MASSKPSTRLINHPNASDFIQGRRLPLMAFLAVFVVLSVTLLVRTYASGGVTLFSGNATPKLSDSGDAQAVELGFKFKSDVDGTVTGVRYYKSSQNTGAHIGNLWTTAGQNLATATFTNESSSGWQQVNFSQPVAIKAGTTYVASYHTNTGHYADDIGGFTAAINAAPLHAPADGTEGPNGVYAYGATSKFPSSGWQASNYWVDVVFNPATSPSPTATPSPTPSPSATLSLDQQVVAHPTSAATTIATPALTTTSDNELLVAFIASDGNRNAATTVGSVTGGGLTWTLRQRSNAQAGGTEIWQAVAPKPLSQATISATLSGKFVSSMVVAAFKNADTTSAGAVAAANAASGAPAVSLTTTRNGSWVWGAGNDWDNPTARTIGAGQILVDQYLASVGDAYWVQRVAAPTTSAGTRVILNNTAPTTDRWNMAAIEILPAVAPSATPTPTPAPTRTPSPTPTPSASPSPSPSPAPDTTAPSAPTALSATAISSSQINLSWTPSSDNLAVTSYDIYRNGTKVGSSTTPSYSDTGLVPKTAYSYTVHALDAAGNMSAASATASASTLAAPDTSAPAAPTGLNASAISPTQVSLTWGAATDNVGVIDYLVLRGTTVIAVVTSPSYTDTVVANTTYSYTVKARDAAGNVSAASNAATVTTPNPPDTAAPNAPTNLAASAASSTQINLSWAPSTDNIGVAGYNIFRGSTKIATATTTSYGDGTVAAGTSYTYSVSAFDAAGNTSAKSAAVTVTTPGGATPTPTPTPSPSPVPSGWPSSADTGYKHAPGYPGSLTPFTGTLESGKTYRYMSFEPGFGVENVTNVTFIGCWFKGADSAFANVVVRGSNNITFDYVSFTPRDYATPPTSGQIPHNGSSQFGLWVYPTNPGKVTIDHSDFWGFGNGIQFFSAYDPAKPFTVRNSYFHDARNDGNGEDHTDGILQGGSSSQYVVIDHNTIVSQGNTNGLALQDQTDQDITVTNNYFSGFGYTVAVGVKGPNTNVVFTGNTFGTDIKPVWGPLYGWPSGTGNVWRNNKWRVAPGTTWSAASNDGKYWWPNGTLSTTDYTGQ